MKLLGSIAFLMLFISLTNAQILNHSDLKRQLDSISELDQKYREILSAVGAGKAIDSLWRLQNSIDSSNISFIKNIIDKYGYPGKTLVGVPTNEAAWYVIQHSRKIDQFLPLIKKNGKSGQLPFKLYAMMYDRFLVEHKKPQIYGTQITRINMKSGINDWFVWPIRNPGKVNNLRKKAGFDQTVEDNAKALGVQYKVIKMSEIKVQ